ncbi:MAG: response regulator [Candidatus Omnitrophica bacterium]|nr:response regulator [Candidatus Omnitrophota bacterium]
MAAPPPESEKRPIIVVADDDVDILNVIKLKLEANGYRAITARDGQEAIAAVQKHRPAFVILDVMMPRLNGFQVARMIKFDKRLKSTPVLLLTVRQQETDRNLGHRVGADEYLAKPFDPQQLLDRIASWLKRKAEPTPRGET